MEWFVHRNPDNMTKPSRIIKFGLGMAAALVSQLSQAQITINNADLISPGDSIVYLREDFTAAVGDSGTNQLWDFSFLDGTNPNLTRSVIYGMTPSSTPYNVAGTNLALMQDSIFQYFERRTSGNNQGLYLKGLGIGTGLVGGLIPGGVNIDPVLTLTTAQPIIRTPYTFNNRYSGNSGTNRIAIPYSDTIQQGSLTLFVDSVGVSLNIRTSYRVNGWGTMTLGSRTMPALRDVSTFSLGFGISVFAYTRTFGIRVPLGWVALPAGTLPLPEQVTTSVRYWSPNSKLHMVQFYMDSLGTTATGVEYQEATLTSLQNKLGQPSLVKLVPNPASGQVMLETPVGMSPRRVQVTTLAGKQVELPVAGKVLDISSLTPGTYMLTTSFDGNFTDRQRLVVR